MVAAHELIDRCRHGDQDAARVLVAGYYERLLPFARGRINRRLAGRLDAEDIVQSVFCAFFCRLKNDWPGLNDHDALLRLLVRMTVCKTLKQVTYHSAQKRHPRFEIARDTGEHRLHHDLPSSEPTPEMTAMFLDQLEHLMSRLTLKDRRVLELRLQGYTTGEIARMLNTYDRLIRRIVERIRAAASLEGIVP
jgi:RNA polymerase sigma-70 factor (ECF subfamily)